MDVFGRLNTALYLHGLEHQYAARHGPTTHSGGGVHGAAQGLLGRWLSNCVAELCKGGVWPTQHRSCHLGWQAGRHAVNVQHQMPASVPLWRPPVTAHHGWAASGARPSSLIFISGDRLRSLAAEPGAWHRCQHTQARTGVRSSQQSTVDTGLYLVGAASRDSAWIALGCHDGGKGVALHGPSSQPTSSLGRCCEAVFL
jgi:hypothetical protein